MSVYREVNNDFLDNATFKQRRRKPRHELAMPQLTFHHADSWMKTIGLEAFSAWLKMYTFCDRKEYPEDNVVQHKDVKNLAEEFGCGKDKAQKIIRTLYEHGLIDIVQEKNKYGSFKNIYYWLDIPIYADTMYCELQKCRSWDDKKWEGQKLQDIRKIKEEQKKRISLIQDNIQNMSNNESRTEISYSSCAENQYSSNHEPYGKSVQQPYEKTVQQPYGKSGQYNNTNIININNNLLNDRMRNMDQPEILNSESKINHSSNQNTANNLESDFEIVAAYYKDRVGGHTQILPYLFRWVSEYGKDQVIYILDRLSEQNKVTNVVRWIEKALPNAEKYPPKITLEKKSKEEDEREKRKQLLDTLYLS